MEKMITSRHNFFVRAIFFALAIAFATFGSLRAATSENKPATNSEPKAEVVIVSDRLATEAFVPSTERVQLMVQRGVLALTGKTNLVSAWRTLLSTNGVVSANGVIGLKVFSQPGPNSGTRPAVVAAVIEGLLAAGVPARHIIIWDKETADLRTAGFFDLAEHYGVRAMATAQSAYDEKTFYESELLGNLIWGDVEFGHKGSSVGRKSYVSKAVSREMTKIISITPLLNHNLAGVSGHLYGLAVGSVDNIGRFEANSRALVRAIPEICALAAIGDKDVLNITDALICQYEGGERGLLHYSTVLNELRFSRDPVALDVLSVEELNRQREKAKAPPVKTSPDLYSNASLVELGVSDPKRIHVQVLN
jgi:hypothetical protein